jgi:TetR/AcrR family transcriptional regulator, transcriptional repressor for nem operon
MNLNIINNTENTEPVPHPKERLIRTAGRLVHQQGWTATGINQILLEANIPKGSFYYYFRSKEALGVAVFQLYKTKIEMLLSKTLLNAALEVSVALDSFFSELEKMLIEDGCRFGSPIGSFASETAATSPLLAVEAQAIFKMIEKGWFETLQRGQFAGKVSASLDIKAVAKTAVMLLEGTLLIMKCTENEAVRNLLELAKAALEKLIFPQSISSPVQLLAS